ncbi:MAG: flagellar hook-basal body complex protein FliE [bacterium]
MNISAIPSPVQNMTAPLTMRNFQPELERTNSLRETGLAAGGTQVGGPDPFGNMMKKFVTDVDDKMKTSAAEKNKVLTGEATNLHQAMIAGQESSVAFTLMVELRNKLVESYQELMRAQV